MLGEVQSYLDSVECKIASLVSLVNHSRDLCDFSVDLPSAAVFKAPRCLYETCKRIPGKVVRERPRHRRTDLPFRSGPTQSHANRRWSREANRQVAPKMVPR